MADSTPEQKLCCWKCSYEFPPLFVIKGSRFPETAECPICQTENTVGGYYMTADGKQHAYCQKCGRPGCVQCTPDV